MNWTEKYRPKSLKDIVGNSEAILELKKWAEEWESNKPEKKAVILYGKPGVGKTSSAYALANDFGWYVIELNASDERSRGVIEEVALAGAVNEAIGYGTSGEWKEGVKKLILLDEADNLYEREGDFGGKKAIIETIKKSKQPIIIIANDLYELFRNAEEMRKICKLIEFKKIRNDEIVGLLKKICANEGIICDENLLYVIANRSGGDLRSAINDLQSISYSKRIGREMLSFLGYRDREMNIFEGIIKIFEAKDIKKAVRTAREIDEEPESLILWIDENLPHLFHFSDLPSAYYYLSRADVFLGRRWKRQYYGMWSYASDLMSGCVAISRRKEVKGRACYFPRWLREMAKSKAIRQAKLSAAKKIGEKIHASSKKTLEIVEILRNLLISDEGIKILAKFDLSEDEISAILSIDKEKAREIYENVKKYEMKGKQSYLFQF
ncbi:MAG: replication factor C large subunit [Thermoplasmatales archaeon]|nr:replication factor C large subunit [Thermoplasmatales archaeon]